MREDASIVGSSEAAGIPEIQTGELERKQLPYYLSWYRGVFGGTGPPADKVQADRNDSEIPGAKPPESLQSQPP